MFNVVAKLCKTYISWFRKLPVFKTCVERGQRTAQLAQTGFYGLIDIYQIDVCNNLLLMGKQESACVLLNNCLAKVKTTTYVISSTGY